MLLFSRPKVDVVTLIKCFVIQQLPSLLDKSYYTDLLPIKKHHTRPCEYSRPSLSHKQALDYSLFSCGFLLYYIIHQDHLFSFPLVSSGLFCCVGGVVTGVIASTSCLGRAWASIDVVVVFSIDSY